MSRRTLLIALLIALTATVGHAQKPPPLPKATCKLLGGRWVGYWTGGFKVRFTVVPFNEKLAFVLYEHQEQRRSDLNRDGGFAKFENNKLVLGKIELTLVDIPRGRAEAVGNFSFPRTAKLIRCALPDDFLNARIALERRVTVAEDLNGQTFSQLLSYFATQHNLMFLGDKSLTLAELKKLDATICSVPAQENVLLKDVVQQMCDRAGLTFKMDGDAIRVKPKK